MATTSKRRKNQQARPRQALPGVPADALFVNRTELTNKVVKQGCAITVSSVMRVMYFAAGILMGIAAVVARIFFHTSTLATVLVLILGLMTVWQGSRLPLESARSMISQLMKAGEDARSRVCYATNTVFGVVMADGTTRTFAWDTFQKAVASQQVICLVTKERSVLFILDNAGFVKGQAGDFLAFVAQKIQSPTPNAFVRLCDKICRTLDGWSKIQQEARAEEAAKKQAKQERKEAKKQARKKR